MSEPTEEQVQLHVERFGATDHCPFCRAWYYAEEDDADEGG